MKIPKYRKHSTRNLGFVEVKGKRIYFKGAYNSHESLSEYAEFIKQLSSGDQPVKTDIRVTRGDDVPIRFLVAQFLDWAYENYRKKSGRQTGTYDVYKSCITPILLREYGDLPTRLFGTTDLKNLRNLLVKQGLCRNTINAYIIKIKRIFYWGVENELVPFATAGVLKYVKSLEVGKTTARETEPITSVADEIVEKTLPFLPKEVADMVLLQREIGCRPSEVCNIRWCDIDQSDDVWIYEPFEHKTEHKGKRRLIAIRKTGQTILEKYRNRPDGFIFRFKNKIQHKVTKYTAENYAAVILAATKRGKIKSWSPNQLRHRFATDVDRKETARILLGHANQNVTERYIDHDKEKVKTAARRLDD
ncbi:MAG: tyrosine-type recombinase/integrase [Planctomycetaceae bacterium]|jgi:integrase|nr:tyrosine-type recombinase/integrase [Planctomycetaceae bacterium]